MKKITVVLLASIAILSWGCSDEPNPENTPDEEEIEIPESYKGTMYGLSLSMTESQKAANKSVNDFSLFLVDHVSKTCKDGEGFVFSPVTETLVSVMIANGADKNYQKKLLELMGYDSMDRLNRFVGKLVSSLPDRNNGARLEMANSLWIRKGFKISDTYSTTLKDLFGLESSVIDFSDENAADIINEWSRNATMGIIDKVVNPEDLIPTDYLWASSIYFHSNWFVGFMEDMTTDEEFKSPSGTIKVPMMHQRNVPAARYAAADDYQYVCIPFLNLIRFQVILPPEGKLLSNVIADMPEEIAELITRQATIETESAVWDHIHISMPRFACKSDLNFSDLYQLIGLKPSSFPGFITDYVQPMEMKQNASISVDENGISVASTSTSMGVEAGYPSEAKEYNVVIDRPFYFFITNGYTGTILFAGMITNP